MRGPKTKVKEALKIESTWDLALECSHVVWRPIKKRRTPGIGESEVDPAPIWVYCERCAEETVNQAPDS